MKTRVALLLLVFCIELFALFEKKSDITLAPLFQNNMVLQQQSNVPIWGWADTAIPNLFNKEMIF